jgi:subtilisin family serine protease
MTEFTAIEGIQLLKLPPGRDIPAVIDRYQRSGLVDFAEPDLQLELALAPNDPAYTSGSLWHLYNYGQNSGLIDADIDAPEAWDQITTATNILVALVDSGLRHTHEDLAANVWINSGEIPGNGIDDDADGYVDNVYGINAAAGTGQPIDLIGHGTMVAGLVGAVGGNGRGVTGVAWRVNLLPCRFTDDAGNVFLSNAAKAMDFARAKGARIINASFINTLYSGTLYAAINSCRAAGIIVVAAAGNAGVNNDNTPYYPASYNLDNIVAVAATTRGDVLASYSNYGAASVDLAAPGSELNTTYNTADNAYTFNSGTSFSAPVVTGALALLRSRHPSATHRQIINQLLNTTDRLPSLAGKCVSGGRLNLARALEPTVAARFTASPPGGTIPLTVRFTNTSLGLPASLSWDFGDGTSTNESDPVHVYTMPGSYQVSLTLLGVDGAVSTTNRSFLAVASYQVTNAPFAWIDPASMTALNLTGDAVSPAQPLPFPFRFFGDTYGALYVGANGLIGLTNQSLGSAANTDLPNASAPNNIICPFWDDLNPSATSVRWGVVGTAPHRRAVVSWLAAAAVGNPAANFTFQAFLEEDSHDIVFQYQDVQPESRHASAAGKSATIGIEHRSGLAAVRFAYNGSLLLSNGQSIRFVAPPSLPVTNEPPQAVTLLQPNWNGGAFSFGFTGQVGRLYEAQFTESLTPTNWVPFGGALTGRGGILVVTNLPPAPSPRIFRIESK